MSLPCVWRADTNGNFYVCHDALLPRISHATQRRTNSELGAKRFPCEHAKSPGISVRERTRPAIRRSSHLCRLVAGSTARRVGPKLSTQEVKLPARQTRRGGRRCCWILPPYYAIFKVFFFFFACLLLFKIPQLKSEGFTLFPLTDIDEICGLY